MAIKWPMLANDIIIIPSTPYRAWGVCAVPRVLDCHITIKSPTAMAEVPVLLISIDRAIRVLIGITVAVEHDLAVGRAGRKAVGAVGDHRPSRADDQPVGSPFRTL